MFARLTSDPNTWTLHGNAFYRILRHEPDSAAVLLTLLNIAETQAVATSPFSAVIKQPLVMPSEALPCPADAALPAGWRADVDANGNTFYLNDLTKETQWERPGLTSQVLPTP